MAAVPVHLLKVLTKEEGFKEGLVKVVSCPPGTIKGVLCIAQVLMCRETSENFRAPFLYCVHKKYYTQLLAPLYLCRSMAYWSNDPEQRSSCSNPSKLPFSGYNEKHEGQKFCDTVLLSE